MRYYADKRTGLYEKMREIDKSPEVFGDTTVIYIGDKDSRFGIWNMSLENRQAS